MASEHLLQAMKLYRLGRTRRAVGKTWRLKPYMSHWFYVTVVSSSSSIPFFLMIQRGLSV